MASLLARPMSDKQGGRMSSMKAAGSGGGSKGVTKRNLTQSTSFMDALDGASPAPKKKSKKTDNVSEKKKRRSIDDPNDLLGGICKSMSKMKESGKDDVLPIRRTPPLPTYNRPPSVSPPPVQRQTKIRFADEHGGELVQVQYFEVERGERVNVYHQRMMSHEQIRAMECEMEKRSVDTNMDESDDAPAERHPYRLVPLDVEKPKERAKRSVEKETEFKRQSMAMEAFYNPNCPSEFIGEPDLSDIGPTDRHRPKNIPMDRHSVAAEPKPAIVTAAVSTSWKTPANAGPVVDATPMQPTPAATVAPTEPSTSAASATVPAMSEKLAALLSGLKKNGILAGGATALAPQPAPQPTPQPTPNYGMPPATVTYAQEPVKKGPTYQQEYYMPPGANAFPQFPPAGPPFSRPNNLPPPIQHRPRGAYVATMPPPATNNPQFSSPSAPALPVINKGFNKMSTVVPPSLRDREDDDFERPMVKPRGPFNGPVMGGYRQCKMFSASGNCRFGDRCRYAHGDQPPPAAAGVRKNAANRDGPLMP
ncbi:unnamed protein product, partial [Mesorhabditis spiculigera]